MNRKNEYPYWNPYLVGIGIGFLIILSYVFSGRGLGAIGAFSSLISSLVDSISTEHAQENIVYSSYLSGPSNPLKDWVVFVIAGVCLGGLVSGILSRRFKIGIIKGPRISNIQRLALAFSGGILMGFAAKITRGCTSGLALSGGSVLSTGAWLFMISVFIGGYAIAFLIKRVWN